MNWQNGYELKSQPDILPTLIASSEKGAALAVKSFVQGILRMLHWLRRMDGTTRFFFLGLVWIAGYFVSIFTFSLAFNQHIAKLMMNYYTDQGVYLNVGPFWRRSRRLLPSPWAPATRARSFTRKSPRC